MGLSEKSIIEVNFDYIIDLVEVTFSKMWAKENQVEDIDLCISNRMGVDFVESYLERNMVMSIGNTRHMLESIINIYKYIKVDRTELNKAVKNLKEFIRAKQHNTITGIEDIDDASEEELVQELNDLNFMLTQHDATMLERIFKLNKDLPDFIKANL